MSAVNHGTGNGKGNYNGSGSVSKPDAAALGDRLPPQNLEAEQSVLGSILLDNDVLHEIIPMLDGRRFLPRRASDSSMRRFATSTTWARGSTRSPWPTS